MDPSDNVSATPLCPVNVCNSSSNHTVVPDMVIDTPQPIIVIISVSIESVFTLIGLFCIVANTINLIVFYRQGLQDRMNLCLFSLALSDLCLVLFYSYVGPISLLHTRPFDNGEMVYPSCLQCITYATGFLYAFRTTSGLFIMVISVERCMCVLFPLQAQSLITSRTMAKILVFIAVLCQLGFVAQPLKYDHVKVKVAGHYEWIIVASKIYLENQNIIDIIVHAIFNVSVPLIVFCIVSLATFITVIQLAAAAAWRRKTSCTSVEHNSQQMALTHMLVLSSCVFIVSLIPVVVVRIVRLFIEDFSTFGKHRDVYGLCSRLANGSPVISSFVTFFIYYYRSSRYRNEFQKLRCSINRCQRVAA